MKKNSRFRILVVLIIVLVIIVAIFKNNKQDNLQVATVLSEISDYNYTVSSNQTKIYKKYFEELKDLLNKDQVSENEYASLLAKLFIIDFYTLSNKVSNQDVGGLEFVHSNYKDNFRIKATDTIYKYVYSNVYGNRKQSLPEIKDVEIINVNNESYKYEDIVDENSFVVEAKCSYVKKLDYADKFKLRFIHEDKKLSIISIEEI